MPAAAFDIIRQGTNLRSSPTPTSAVRPRSQFNIVYFLGDFECLCLLQGESRDEMNFPPHMWRRSCWCQDSRREWRGKAGIRINLSFSEYFPLDRPRFRPLGFGPSASRVFPGALPEPRVEDLPEITDRKTRKCPAKNRPSH